MLQLWFLVTGIILVGSSELKKFTCVIVKDVNSSDWLEKTPSINPTWKPVTDDPTPPPTISSSTISYEIPFVDGNEFIPLSVINDTKYPFIDNNTAASTTKPVPLLRSFEEYGGKKEKGVGKKGKKVYEDG